MLKGLTSKIDSNKRNMLEWKIRCQIIEGVAQGLVYLHQYSRLKVIHRDLKASNILLDNELNPKISDFGTARIFELAESEEQTNRIVGTYGYMSPEYAMRGVISTKIDVYSFGVLLLEIAWKLWNEGEALNLTDTLLDGSCPPIQVLRYIHIGLLCTQDQAKERPTMVQVVSFLSNEIAELPLPKQPGFCSSESMEEIEQPKSCSNEITMSLTSGSSAHNNPPFDFIFKLSFFQFNGSQDFYLGIRLSSSDNSSSSYFWIANRDMPILENHKRTKLLSEIGGNTAISIAYNEIREQRKDGRTSDDMHIFNFQTILEATAHFSSTNKIREGGFGPVYKGKLLIGQEVAIKRLSKRSGQGLIEFKNEAMLIVELQHTNLVSLFIFTRNRDSIIPMHF
ncbi:G-type lectin S-receptor-like serine/threonine-protein kinase SD1-13 [Glycine max]|nr:G-type lectin S-receptor-like serine/threonine-protein kinase SD1-13 [Glycine max]